ncbi:MAG: hypothetical protein ACPGVG_15055, partial [Mycobacterium sp.]
VPSFETERDSKLNYYTHPDNDLKKKSRRSPRRKQTGHEIAEVFGVNAVTVRQWSRQGLPCTRKKGKANLYDEAEVAAWMESKGITGKVGRPKEEGPKSLDAARMRKEYALARKHEIYVEREQGRLLDADEVRRQWVKQGTIFRNRMMTIGASVAVLFPDIAVELQRAIEDRIVDALNALADEHGTPQPAD